MRKLQCFQNTLTRIVTNCNKYTRASPILKRLHWLPLEFCCIFSKKKSFFTVVIPVTLVLFCLLVVEDIVQDTTIQIKSSFRFLNSVHLYIYKKTHFGHSFGFDAPTVWNHLPDEVCSAPTLACFRKRLKLYLFSKAFPN